jgi:hypothetical protein
MYFVVCARYNPYGHSWQHTGFGPQLIQPVRLVSNRIYFYVCTCLQQCIGGRDSAVGVATRYELDGSEFVPQWRQNVLFPSPVQTGPEDHRASCSMNTGGRAWRWPPTPPSAKGKNE